MSLLTQAPDPPMGYRFTVVFLSLGVVPQLLDMKFQKVSGLSRDIDTSTVREGGENHYTHRLPDKVNNGNLVLQRGMTALSPVNIEFNLYMSYLEFFTGNVLVTINDSKSIPIAGWLFLKAYPVKWSVSDLDAEQDELVIDTFELAYTECLDIRL